MERQRPFFVYADYEALPDENGVQTPILLCLEDADSYDTQSFYGENCTDDLFDHLDELAFDENGNDRNVLHVSSILRVTTACSSYSAFTEATVKSPTRSIWVPRSCFLPFSLSNFPATFGVTEVRVLSTSLQYVGESGVRGTHATC